MRSKAPLIFLIAAAVLAAGAAWGAHQWLRLEAAKAAAKKLAMTKIVVVNAELPAGQKLETSNLTLKPWPRKLLPAGYFKSIKDVSGRVLKSPATPGEVVIASKLAPKGATGGLAAILPDGFRALTVRVDEVIGVGGYVQAGDRVDVLLTFNRGVYQNDPATKTVVQNVSVLTVGETVVGTSRGKKKASITKVTSVTLKLNPGQAEKLALSMLEGKVVLALRNRGDSDDRKTEGVRLTSLLPGIKMPAAQPAAAPAPKEAVAPPAKGSSIELIKGSKRQQQAM